MESLSFERGVSAQTRTQKRACYCLYALNTVSFGIGMAVLVLSAVVAHAHASIAGSVYAAAAVGGFLVLVSLCGIAGARRERQGASGKTLLLAYFYAALLAAALLIIVAIGALEFRVRLTAPRPPKMSSHCGSLRQDTFDKYIEDHWEDIQDEFPELRGLVRHDHRIASMARVHVLI